MIARTIDRRSRRLIVRSIADHDDWSYDRSSGATIDLRSVAESHDWSYDRLPSATIDRTIDRRVPRLIYDRSQNSTIARTIDRRVPRLIYDRSQNSTIDRTIDRLWLPLVVRFPTMDHAIDPLQSLLVARPHVRPIVRWPTTSQKTGRIRPTASGDRQIATNHTIKQSYDPVWAYT